MNIKNNFKRWLLLISVCSFTMLNVMQAHAGPTGLLGVQPVYPKFNVTSNAGQGATYDGSQLIVTSAPVFYTLNATTVAEFVSAGDLTITANIDSAGSFTGGSFTVSGSVGTSSGVLLSGTVDDYGISNTGINTGDTDFVDFALTATGGALLSDFPSGGAGAVIALEGSTFDGTFTAPWGAVRAKGDLGSVVITTNGKGTGTIGYWKNHPNSWSVDSLTLGDVTYSKSVLISILKTPTRGDKSIAMAKQLIATKLSLADGTDPSCITDTVTAADNWLAAHGGVGSGQRQWDNGDLLHDDLDAYNNGLLCAPHRGQT